MKLRSFLSVQLSVLSLLTLLAPSALAAPGDIDAGFNGGIPAVIDNNPGAAIGSFSAAIDPANGDTVWAGIDFGTGQTGGIAVYKPDGTLDNAVGTNGQISLSADQAGVSGGALSLNTIAVDDQGRILAGGVVVNTSSEFAMVLARFNPDGTLDTSFGSAGTGIITSALNGHASAKTLALTPDGHILVIGSAANTAFTEAQLTVWRFNADGTPDSGFGDNGHTQIAALSNNFLASGCISALQPNGKLLAVCDETASGPWKLTRLNPDGSVDDGFGIGGFVLGGSGREFAGLALAPDGGFVVSELDTSVSPHPITLRRFLADGSVDPNFNGGNPFNFGTSAGYGDAIPLAVQPDGKILVAANDNVGTGAPDLLRVQRLSPDGTPDSGFGNTGDPGLSVFSFSGIGSNDYTPYPTALLLQGDGKIVATGYAASTAGSSETAFTTRLDNDIFDLTPDALVFSNDARAPLGQTVASNAVSLTGISIGSETSGVYMAFGTDGKYSTSGNSGPFMGEAESLNPAWSKTGDSLALEQMTPDTAGTDTTTQVIYGGFWAPNNYEVPLGNHTTTTWTTTTDTPPSAHDGTLDATAGQAATGTLNADNPSGGSLAFNIVTQPSHGTLSLDSSNAGTYTYTADRGYTGADSFTWKVNDGVADSNMATVAVSVRAASKPPSGGGGGGGSFAGLALALLALLCLGFPGIRRRIKHFS